MRISRPCYDKPWRCPGWAGGGMRYAKRDRCTGGRVQGRADARWPHLWFHRCNTCGVVTWPYVLRWLDPGWWRWEVSSWRDRWRDRELCLGHSALYQLGWWPYPDSRPCRRERDERTT